MNPFVNPEFWLSLAFIVVAGLVLFPPVRRAFIRFFNHQQQMISDQISQADDILNEAQNLLQKTQKTSLSETSDKTANQQIKSIQQEVAEKIKTCTETRKQDFQVRQKMAAMHLKNNLRTELLNQVQKKVLSSSSKKALEKDFNHFISFLKKNRDVLEQIKTP